MQVLALTGAVRANVLHRMWHAVVVFRRATWPCVSMGVVLCFLCRGTGDYWSPGTASRRSPLHRQDAGTDAIAPALDAAVVLDNGRYWASEENDARDGAELMSAA